MKETSDTTPSRLKPWVDLPPSVRAALRHTASLTMGLLAALAVYYTLYRITLPSKPFIYVAF